MSCGPINNAWVTRQIKSQCLVSRKHYMHLIFLLRKENILQKIFCLTIHVIQKWYCQHQLYQDIHFCTPFCHSLEYFKSYDRYFCFCSYKLIVFTYQLQSVNIGVCLRCSLIYVHKKLYIRSWEQCNTRWIKPIIT